MTSRYYNMTDSTGVSGFLPTVTFTSTDASFTSTQRSSQLASIGITGFYEADFSGNITEIFTGAFQNDTKVVVATINKVTTIGASAFSGCTGLRSITLETAVDASGKYLLTSIGANAFQNCTSLRNLHIPDSVQIIPDFMCSGCSNLEVAVMGYGCDRTGNTYNRSGRIGQSAFANCSKLMYFVVPETVSTISSSAFASTTTLTWFYILGRPDISANAFTSAKGSGAIYYYDNSASYTNLDLLTSTTPFPTLATKNPYREIDLSAGAAAILTSTDVSNSITSVASYWKGKILDSITGLSANCFRAQTSTSGGIGTTKYSNMIGLSFPSNLNSIGYGAFFNSNGTTPVACNVGGFYIPNSVTTFDVSGGNAHTFQLTNVTGHGQASTKQFVFQSGRTTPITTLPSQMFQYTSAIAMVIPAFTNMGSSCFFSAYKIQYFNFFQKNAYNTLTKIDGATTNSGSSALASCFQPVTNHTIYLYIPKAVSSISTNAIGTIFSALNITVYSSATDGSYDGLCASSNYLTSSYFTSNAGNITFNIINNYCNTNGVSLGTSRPLAALAASYHVLFYPPVSTISNRFASSTNLKTITILDTVTDISASAFASCTGLTSINVSPTGSLVNIGSSAFNGCTSLANIDINRAKSIGPSAFYNAPLTNTFDLSSATSLEANY